MKTRQYKRDNLMSREQIIETMRYLGWVTHDQDGQLTDETYYVANELAGRIPYGVTTPSLIATEVDKYRASTRQHNGEGI